MIRVRWFTPGELTKHITEDPKETNVGVMVDLDPDADYAVWAGVKWQVCKGRRCWVPMVYRTDIFETAEVPENMKEFVREVFICGGMIGFFLSLK